MQDHKNSIKERWNAQRGNTKRKKSVLTSLPMLIVFLIAIFALFYVLEGYIK